MAEESRQGKKKKTILAATRHSTQLLLFAILVLLFLFFGVSSPVFFEVNTLMALLKQASIYGMIALGMTLVITSAGIDISVGSTVGLSGVVASMCMVGGLPIPVSILVAMGASVLVGLFNGIIVFDANVPPFIATMGSLIIVRNIIMLITGAATISNLPKSFTGFASGTFMGIPYLFLSYLALILVTLFLANKTVFGRNIYAYGSNKEAARLSGINVRFVVYGVYIFCAIVCGFAGILLASRLGNGVPDAGTGYELDAIAASVVGGASLDGGESSVIGTVLGAMIMATLRQGGTLLGVNSFILEIIIGSLIVIAVVLDKVRKKRN